MKKLASNQSGVILLGVLVIMLFLSILLSATFLRSEMQLKVVNQRRDLQEAFYAAEAGIDRAIFELRKDPDWGLEESANTQDPNVINDERLKRIDNDDQTTLGFYSVSVSEGPLYDNKWPTRIIRSVGEDESTVMNRTLEAQVLVENPARFLFASMGDLRLISGSDSKGDILARDLYFDVNEALPDDNKGIRVDGDVFWIRSITGEDDDSVDITGDTQQSPAITFAGVDLIRYRDVAMQLQEQGTSIYNESDQDFTVNLDEFGETGQKPLIIFAEHDVIIQGNYGHSLIVVAGGSIYIDGDIVPDSAMPNEARPQIGLFAAGDVIIPEGAVSADGDLTLEAFVVADGQNENSDGAFTAKGPKSSLGTLNFNGAVSVRGKGRTSIDMNAFIKRDYVYNPELNVNRQIPFTPFIVNLIEWKETTFYGQTGSTEGQ